MWTLAKIAISFGVIAILPTLYYWWFDFEEGSFQEAIGSTIMIVIAMAISPYLLFWCIS